MVLFLTFGGCMVFAEQWSIRSVSADGDPFTSATDCDDADPEVYPGAPERCNGVDDNCDGEAEDLVEVYVDADGDGLGAGPAMIGCEDDGFAPSDGDCDDTNPDLPAANEIPYNLVDDDCAASTADMPLSDLASGTLEVAEAQTVWAALAGGDADDHFGLQVASAYVGEQAVALIAAPYADSLEDGVQAGAVYVAYEAGSASFNASTALPAGFGAVEGQSYQELGYQVVPFGEGEEVAVSAALDGDAVPEDCNFVAVLSSLPEQGERAVLPSVGWAVDDAGGACVRNDPTPAIIDVGDVSGDGTSALVVAVPYTTGECTTCDKTLYLLEDPHAADDEVRSLAADGVVLTAPTPDLGGVGRSIAGWDFGADGVNEVVATDLTHLYLWEDPEAAPSYEQAVSAEADTELAVVNLGEMSAGYQCLGITTFDDVQIWCPTESSALDLYATVTSVEYTPGAGGTGTPVVSADLDGDGSMDLAVGGRLGWLSWSEGYAGQVQVYMGPIGVGTHDFLDGPSHVLFPAAPTGDPNVVAEFGGSIAAHPDPDGATDLLVGAAVLTEPGTEGAAWLVDFD